MAFNFYDYLQNMGISSKEIKVYLYLLSVESAVPVQIAKEIKLKRSTAYVILDTLKNKGLVREIQVGKRLAYVAEDPERLKFILEEIKLQTEESIKSLDIILPQLKATLRKKGEAPLIKFFEGESAVQSSMEELAKNPKFRTDMDFGIFPLELVYKLFRSRNMRKYIDLRLKENKLFKIIYTCDDGEIKTRDGQEAIKVDNEKYPFSCDISIFEDEVRIHMLGKSIYGILIKNPELADTLVSIFKLAEKGARSN